MYSASEERERKPTENLLQPFPDLHMCSAFASVRFFRCLIPVAVSVCGAGALAADWPHFLGPSYNATSTESGLHWQWPEGGPRKLWEFEKGRGWACPTISEGKLVLLHRLSEREAVECLDPVTGKPVWRFDYAAPYRDRYGASDGPRTSAVIKDGRVFTYGVTGLLHCLDLQTGKLIWKKDIDAELSLIPNFFGCGSTPLLLGDKVIVNVGAKDDLCVIAFDAATGKEQWRARHEWGGSYASPIPATIHGRECVLVFAGGESRPPTGGLLTIDAKTGEVLNATPHRADIPESVNASSPALDGNRVFVTEAYGAGGRMVEIASDFSAKPAWHAEKFGAYFMTPIIRDGVVYGFDGQSSRLAELVAYQAEDGKELWRDDLGGKFGKGSLLLVDGRFLALGEFGELLQLDLSRNGAKVLHRTKLFHAPETWTLPALSNGLLYVSQNERSSDGQSPRVICYDLRGK